MRSFYLMACVLLVGTFGCAPQLAQKPLGEEEIRWEKYVKKKLLFTLGADVETTSIASE